MSSVFGKNLIVSIFGQSHSKAIGVSVDNLPPGFLIDFDKLQLFMERRSAQNKDYATKRAEPDKIEIVAGLVNGKTCGAPLCALIYNSDFKPSDYDSVKNIPRPSHADYTSFVKYKGFQDPTGGGHFSGRLTAPLCVAGGICMQVLEQEGITINAHIKKIYGIEETPFNSLGVSKEQIDTLKQNNFPVLDVKKGAQMLEAIQKASQQQDSVGGVIECIVQNLPVGMGDPMFDGIENNISKAVFAIPAVKGIEFGSGFSCADMLGSQHSDAFYENQGEVLTRTNNHGGILGGITSAMPVIFRVAIKPTSSIALPQDSVNLSTMKDEVIEIKGRHDPCIVPRAVPCVEAAAAIALLDMYMSYRIWR